MAKPTQTRLHRRIWEETGEVGKDGKPVIKPTGKILPPQARKVVEHDLGNGHALVVTVAPGQVINIVKLFKRIEKGDTPSWFHGIKPIESKKNEELPPENKA